MGSLLLFAFSWWGILLQAFAIIHFIRRRPDTFWLWIILIGGWLGALVYIAVEAVPDAGLLRQSFKVFPRRKRIRELESAILDNPSAYNNKLVRVRGIVSVSSEYSTLNDPKCSDGLGIWFAFADGSGPPGLEMIVNGKGTPGGKKFQRSASSPYTSSPGPGRRLS